MARNQFIRDGEDVLVELAYLSTAAEIPSALFSSIHAHGFDVPARSAHAIARLEKRARELDQAEPLKEHIRNLARIREEWIDAMEKCLGKANDASTRKFIAASLGDADAAIEIFSQPGYSEIPQYRERLREAEMKKRRAVDCRGSMHPAKRSRMPSTERFMGARAARREVPCRHAKPKRPPRSLGAPGKAPQLLL